MGQVPRGAALTTHEAFQHCGRGEGSLLGSGVLAHPVPGILELVQVRVVGSGAHPEHHYDQHSY